MTMTMTEAAACHRYVSERIIRDHAFGPPPDVTVLEDVCDWMDDLTDHEGTEIDASPRVIARAWQTHRN